MNELVADRKCWRSRHRCDGHAMIAGGQSFRQINFPSPFTLVHVQFHTGRGGRMIDEMLHQKKIRPHLPNGKTQSVNQQTHGHARGMAAAAGRYE